MKKHLLQILCESSGFSTFELIINNNSYLGVVINDNSDSEFFVKLIRYIISNVIDSNERKQYTDAYCEALLKANKVWLPNFGDIFYFPGINYSYNSCGAI